MAIIKLRDRDAILTQEGLIFRVLGYTHPSEGFICDLEYSPAKLFKSDNPKAYRTDGKQVFYKFYEDEGWSFIQKQFPRYMIFYAPLNRKVIGVKCDSVAEVRKPEEVLKRLVETVPKDELVKALKMVLKVTVEDSGLSVDDFGVFGSLLHGFYHPKFSDIDLIVYGRGNLARVREVLQELYADAISGFSNEFENDAPIKGKHWRFKNISLKEFVWHQKRKLIYGVFHDSVSGRTIKLEFEPVKNWNETRDGYEEIKRITRKGWIKAFMRVTDDSDAVFMPSVYAVEPLKIVENTRVENLKRIVSYLEEFRMQAWKDEVVYVEGNLEKVETNRESFHQVTLTYGPRYYEQVLKVTRHFV